MEIFTFYIPVITVLGIATYTDLKSRKIYNWLTYTGIVYFFLIRLLLNIEEIFSYVLGFILLLIITLVIAITTKSLGGGDIKLFALIGMAYGVLGGLSILFYSYVCAVIFTLPILILRKIFPEKIKVKSIPLAPFISLGTLIYHFFPGDSPL